MAPSDEIGTIRRKHDGTFEYLRSQRLSLRDGYTEVWEPAATHAARYLNLPPKFYAGLLAAGYTGGSHLYDLLIAEGWTPPGEHGVVEIDARASRPITGGERRALEAGE